MSFRLKTVLGIALIELFVLAILVATSLHDLRYSNERELRSRAQTSAKLLATMTTDAVVASDLATLDVLVAQAMSNEGLMYVQIKNEAGLVSGRRWRDTRRNLEIRECRRRQGSHGQLF